MNPLPKYAPSHDEGQPSPGRSTSGLSLDGDPGSMNCWPDPIPSPLAAALPDDPVDRLAIRVDHPRHRWSARDRAARNRRPGTGRSHYLRQWRGSCMSTWSLSRSPIIPPPDNAVTRENVESGWPDLNRRPLRPERSALTKLRHSPLPRTGGWTPILNRRLYRIAAWPTVVAPGATARAVSPGPPPPHTRSRPRHADGCRDRESWCRARRRGSDLSRTGAGRPGRETATDGIPDPAAEQPATEAATNPDATSATLRYTTLIAGRCTAGSRPTSPTPAPGIGDR